MVYFERASIFHTSRRLTFIVLSRVSSTLNHDLLRRIFEMVKGHTCLFDVFIVGVVGDYFCIHFTVFPFSFSSVLFHMFKAISREHASTNICKGIDSGSLFNSCCPRNS